MCWKCSWDGGKKRYIQNYFGETLWKIEIMLGEDKADSKTCPVRGFGITDAKTSNSVTTVLVRHVVYK
jgi:hypothetical protein